MSCLLQTSYTGSNKILMNSRCNFIFLLEFSLVQIQSVLCECALIKHRHIPLFTFIKSRAPDHLYQQQFILKRSKEQFYFSLWVLFISRQPPPDGCEAWAQAMQTSKQLTQRQREVPCNPPPGHSQLTVSVWDAMMRKEFCCAVGTGTNTALS